MSPYREEEVSTGRVVALALAVIALLALLISAGKLFEHIDANEIVVIQSPVSGHLAWYKQPGVVWQGFGTVTSYPKQWQFSFSNKKDVGKGDTDESLKIRFNEGGHAQVSGTCNVEMPIDDASLTLLHTKYGSQAAINQQIVRAAVSRSVYMTGPLMSSKESSAERRNELLTDIEDQVQHGIYMTTTTQQKIIDPLSGSERMATLVQPVRDKIGAIARSEPSPLDRYKIRVFNFSIDEVKYDPQVEEQITSQQKMAMDVQTAIVEAKKAEQRAITIAKNGEAEAARAKWEQEVIKAKEVTAAEQRKEVARLDSEAAELKKKEQVLLGEGEAERRKLVMAADGALDKKLDALVKINAQYADAIKGAKLVPDVQMGSNGASGTQAFNLIDLLTAKTARDLGVDLGVRSSKQ